MWTRWRLDGCVRGGRSRRWDHSHSRLSHAPKEALKRQANLEAWFARQEVDGEGIKGFNMLFKIVAGEVRVSLYHVHNDRSPCFYIPRLGLIQLHKTADYVSAEPMEEITS